MADYAWPPQDERSLIGKSISRIDGPWKASGRAKYSFDVNRPGMIFGAMVLSPHAHAKINAIDTRAAEAMPGVRAVQIIVPVGQEVFWAGQEIAAVAADTEEQARDAVRAVQVSYEPLPFLVHDVPPAQAGPNAASPSEDKQGDPDAAFAAAEVTFEGSYGSPVVTHCCLEAHGQVAEWNGDQLTVWASTQNVSGIGGQIASGTKTPAGNIRIITPVMGGGFGSKFAADTWGVACAQLAKKAGKPVKMMLERNQELMGAGARPSLYARVRVAAKRDGTLTAWDSDAWGTHGPSGGGPVPLPYLFTDLPNVHARYTPVRTNIGPTRAWRAPNHPQMCLITLGALDDLAAKLNMDPVELLRKNLHMTARPAVYAAEIDKASELMDWKRKWHPRGQGGSGPVRRGVGVAMHTWGGGGHASNCACTIHPDGSVEVSLGSQDLGTGTRTVIGIVAAETVGLPLDGVQVNIGDSRYPPSGASGGSTTIGGVSSSTRAAATNALNQLFAKVAPALGAAPDKLRARAGRIEVEGDPSKNLSWRQACARLGSTPITANGQTMRDLISSGVGGVQMAEVSVDTDTGVVHMEKMVAVQDCGMIVDLKTAESQVYGACIMGVTYSLFEEKVMDQQTGVCLNPNMEFYKLAGIDDVGEIVVHMMTDPEDDHRGPIGLGEPPTVSPGAAISNAVANAIGVRVPQLPLSPDHVLAALRKV
jgi:xanthine dehydrogenase YagR molybdenum-binding subunit